MQYASDSQWMVFVDLQSEVDTTYVIPQLIQKNLRIAFLSIAVQIENHCLEEGAGNFLSKNELQMFICFPWEMGEGKNHKQTQTKMETNCGKWDKRTIEVASLSQTKAPLLYSCHRMLASGQWQNISLKSCVQFSFVLVVSSNIVRWDLENV